MNNILSSQFARTLFFVYVGHFLVDFMIGIWPIFKTMAHVDLATAGFIAGACVLCGEGMQFVFGPLIDRGYQRALLMGGVGIASASAFLSCGSNIVYYIICYFLTCLGSAAFHPTASSMLGQLESSKKNIVMGLFTTFGALGFSLSQWSFSSMYLALSGNTLLLVVPYVIVVGFLFVWCVPGAPPSESNIKHFSLKTFIDYLKEPELRALYYTLVANQMVLWSLVFLLPDFLASQKYPSWVVFGGGHFCLMVGATLSPLLLGYLADRYSSKKTIQLATICGAALLYAFLLLSLPAVQMVLLLFLLGIALGGISPLIWAAGNALYPKRRGSVSAFLMGGVWIVSEAGGVVVSGILAGLVPKDGPTFALLCVGTVFAIGLYFSSQLTGRTEAVVEME